MVSNKLVYGRFNPAVILVMLLSWGSVAGAADSETLYMARVKVDDPGAAARSEALQQALGLVLLKVTGDRDAAGRAAADPAFRAPERFVQQYRYVSSLPAGDEAAPELWFEVQFDNEALETALRGTGLPLWGQERPSVLVWLAVADSGQRYLVSANGSDPIADALEGAARQRGLPLIFPLQDLQDQARIRFADVWGGFQQQIVAASRRYPASAVLSGRLEKRAGNLWLGRWTLEFGDKRSGWETDGRTPREAVSLAIDEVANRMASQLAVRSTSGGSARLHITVEGVNSLADYARASRYLASLTAVRDVSVNAINADQVDFSIDLQGDAYALDRAVGVGRVLRPLSTEPQRVYRLLP